MTRKGKKTIHEPSFSFGSLQLHYLFRASGIFVGDRNVQHGRRDIRKQNEGFGTVEANGLGKRVNRFDDEITAVSDRDVIDIRIR